MSDTGVSHQAAPLISRHMKDLLRRPIEAVRICLEDPNTAGDVRQRKHSKGLAARAVAARYIIKAIEGSASHGDTLLERVEGKVASQDGSAGSVINFNFNVQGELSGVQVRQVGEIVEGALGSAAINRGMCQGSDTAAEEVCQALDTVPSLAQLNPSSPSTPTINPMPALPATDADHELDK